jgi:HK97 family phage major capsid protein
MNIEQLRAHLTELIGRMAVLRAAISERSAVVAPLAARTDNMTDDETRSLTEAGADLERFEIELAEAEADRVETERMIGIYERATANMAAGNVGQGNQGPAVNPVFGSPAVHRGTDPYAEAARDVIYRGEGRDMAMRAIEAAEDSILSADGKARAAALVAQHGAPLQGHILATGRPAYREAWAKALLGREAEFTDVERQAVIEARAMSLTDAAGGYAVPFTLDPTVIDTGAGSVNPFRQVSRVESIVTDSWNGVSSAGVTAAYAAEAAEAADGAPTFAPQAIPVHKAHVFVPFSVEIEGDFMGLATSVASMITTAKDDLEASVFAVGTGSGQPTGICTALDGGSFDVAPLTANTFAVGDLRALWAGLPAKYRQRANWVMNSTNIIAAQSFGNAAAGGDFTVYLTADGVQTLIGKPVAEASAMVDQKIVLGDFSNYVIVDRVGMSIELVPHLMGANRRPTGQRGFYAWFRNGADSVNDGAFLQKNDLAA